MEELNSRREQLEMMLEWRNGLKGINTDEVDAAKNNWSEMTGFDLTEFGMKDLRKLIRRFGLRSVLDAQDLAFESYAEPDGDGGYDRDSIDHALSKVGGICFYNSAPEHVRKIGHIRGIIRRRMYINEAVCKELLELIHSAGGNLDEQIDLARIARNWTEWRSEAESILEELQNAEG
jgi:hypothetical protein